MESKGITVQYRPSEKKIVFGLIVLSSDGLGLIFMIEIGVLMNFKGQNKAWKVEDPSFLLSKNRKIFQEKQQESTMYN